MKKILLLLLLPGLVLFSCAVQKRKYQKGYHISWSRTSTSKKEKRTAPADPEQSKQPAIAKESPAAVLQKEAIKELASLSKNSRPAFSKEEKKPATQKDDPCDEIIYKDGTEVKGKVTEVTQTEIKYKKCDMPDGPTYVVKKSDIFMIKYANGSREVFKNEKPAEPATAKPNTYKGPQETHPLAIASLVLGILGFIPYLSIVGAILAIVFGNMAIRRIHLEPERYKGEGLAIAGRTIGIIYLALLAIILVIILVAIIAFA